MAGVDQHSDWRRDPVGRLAATSTYIATVTYGDRAGGEPGGAGGCGHPRACPRRRHGDRPPVRGRGSRAAAVGARGAGGFGAGGLDCSARRRPRPTRTPTSREMAVSAELLGVPAEMIPASAAARGRVPRAGPARAALHARRRAESMGYLLDPAGHGRGDRRAVAGPAGRRARRAARLGPGPVRLPRARAGRRRSAGPRSARRSACSTRCSWASRACSRPGSSSTLRMRPARSGHAQLRVRAARLAGAVAGAGGAAIAGLAVAPQAAREAAARGGRGRLRVERGWRRCGWPRAAARGTRHTRRGCSRRRASTGSSCGTTWLCRPPRMSPPPGHDEGRADEAGPDGQLRRRRAGPGRAPDAQPAAGQRAADEPGAGRAGGHRGAGPAAGAGLRHLGPGAYRRRFDRAGAPGHHP